MLVCYAQSMIMISLAVWGSSMALVAPMAALAPSADRIAQLGQDYLDAGFAFSPGAAAGSGLHESDGRPADLSEARIKAYRNTLAELKLRVDRLVREAGTPDQSWRARQLRCAIDGDLFTMDVMRAYTHNPMTYAQGLDVSGYTKRNYAPKAQRMAAATSVLRGVPAVMEAARTNLDEALPEVYIKLAIGMAKGQAEFMSGELLAAFAEVQDAGLQRELKEAAQAASTAMNLYAKWLEVDRLPNGTNDYAIGREAYVRMLSEQELLSQSPEQILEIGLAELKRQQDTFAAAAREIDPNRSAMDIWKDIQHEHPTAERLLDDTRAHLDAIYDFLIQKDLISLPQPTRVIVKETPTFMRAGTFAAMDTPGVFEKQATESYYYVTPPEKDWDEKKADEWLTAFNLYTTDVVSIHEAYPGHFVQALHLHASALSDAEKYLGSYAFIEGWAHYCEQMALDEGFPPESLRKDPHAAAKYRMGQASEALLRVCRLVASIRMHCQGQSLDDATKFFVENAYYEEAPARSEAERGSFDPGYAFYTLGKLEIMKLRAEWATQEGSAFTLKRFHDELLRHGQPPVRLLREKMLKNAKLWDAAL